MILPNIIINRCVRDVLIKIVNNTVQCETISVFGDVNVCGDFS